MDLLQLYQIRMDKCAAEQFWAMALFASMNGFIIFKNKTLVEAVGMKLLKWGIALATVFFFGYILSRHYIYLHYDSLVNQIMVQKASESGLLPPTIEGVRKASALWFGVIFYSTIIIGMGVVSFMATLRRKIN
jgi:hypothetical protein